MTEETQNKPCCKDVGTLYLYLMKNDEALQPTINTILKESFALSETQITQINKYTQLQGACLVYLGAFNDVITRAQILGNYGIAHKVSERSIIR